MKTEILGLNSALLCLKVNQMSQTRSFWNYSPTASQGRFYIKAIKVRQLGGRHIDSSTRAIPPQ